MIFLVSLCCFIVSCGSDELTNSKAKRIIQECLNQIPEERTVTINTKSTRLVGELLEKYQKLQEEGLLELRSIKSNKPKLKKPSDTDDPLKKWQYKAELRRQERNKDLYNINIPKKAEKHITKANEFGDNIKLKAFEYVVDEVLEVREIPSMNSAKVKVRYKSDNLTPFASLSRKDPSEFLIKDITMTKTSNGWKFCDNY